HHAALFHQQTHLRGIFRAALWTSEIHSFLSSVSQSLVAYSPGVAPLIHQGPILTKLFLVAFAQRRPPHTNRKLVLDGRADPAVTGPPAEPGTRRRCHRKRPSSRQRLRYYRRKLPRPTLPVARALSHLVQSREPFRLLPATFPQLAARYARLRLSRRSSGSWRCIKQLNCSGLRSLRQYKP